jgi:hypothetical protein
VRIDMCHSINLDGTPLHPEYWNAEGTPRFAPLPEAIDLSGGLEPIVPEQMPWLDIAFTSGLLGLYGGGASIGLWILYRMIRFAVKG